MRALLVLMILTPAWAGAEPCEKLITAICPETVKRAKCVEFLAERIVMANEKALSAEGRAEWCAATLGDTAKVEEMSGFLLYTDTLTIELKVTVEPSKAGGKPWDGGSALPDIAACFTIDEKTVCVPGGKAPERVKTALCADALSCAFKLDARRGAQVQVRLVDVDAMANDPIGRCVLVAGQSGAECSGAVSVSVSSP